MNANPDTTAGARARWINQGSDPSASARKSRFKNYDDEWRAFFAKNSMTKSKLSSYLEEPEVLPRVWNAPRR